MRDGQITRISSMADGGWRVTVDLHGEGFPAELAEIGAHVAIARLQAVEEVKPDKPKHKWAELTPCQQAGMRCNEVRFQHWLVAKDAAQAADKVRQRCGIESRKELDSNDLAAELWYRLDARYQADVEKEKYGYEDTP